ncbi:MAG TPA: molybdenum cofactor biosynthesis protein MoaE [Thermoanaerobaculia bacterium]|nr:molybdenum cofactor biosynthesis protein MoaE [Thermoanaerobaculia bacterium]
MSYLTDRPIDTSELVRGVMRPSDGACIVFEGLVRNHHEGHKVESIFYDAYRPMAEKEIDRVVSDVSREFAGVAVAVVHRLGHLRVGDTSIAIACSASHRGDAYAASRAVIDRIKETVPIWKKERGPAGEEWVGWQGRC